MEKGKHLLYEAKIKDKEILTNGKIVTKMFKEVIDVLEMRAVSDVEIVYFPGGGLTAFCIIAESHVSIHTWPETNYMAFDLFSCRDFDENAALKTLKKYIDSETELVDVIIRGMGRFVSKIAIHV
jgi:S-adenosylmethionine decarboxylase